MIINTNIYISPHWKEDIRTIEFLPESLDEQLPITVKAIFVDFPCSLPVVARLGKISTYRDLQSDIMSLLEGLYKQEIFNLDWNSPRKPEELIIGSATLHENGLLTIRIK